MSVRVACRADVSQISLVDKSVFGEPLSRAQIASICAHPAAAVFVAEHGDEVAGYLLAYTDHCAAEIMRIGVHPKYRRNGYGKQLVEMLSETIGQDMSIEIKAAGDDIVPWLSACDFRQVESHEGYNLYRRGWRFARAPMLKFRMP